MTLLIETHAWRGLSWDRDLFLVFVVVGWVTIGFSRESLIDRLRELRDRLRRLIGGE